MKLRCIEHEGETRSRDPLSSLYRFPALLAVIPAGVTPIARTAVPSRGTHFVNEIAGSAPADMIDWRDLRVPPLPL